MHPVLFHLGPIPVASHDFFIALGALVGAAVFFLEAHRRGEVGDARLPLIVIGALVTGALFAKGSTGWRWLQQADDPSLAGLWLHGGRSVLGGLAGAWIGAEVVKKLVGYRQSTGDFFAPAVAIAMAIGRIGCFLSEPIGRPSSLPWAMSIHPELGAAIPGCPHCGDGVPMHPAFLYEIAFHLTLFFVLLWLRPRVHVRGELFKLWLLAYGVFRFVNEWVRVNPEFVAGLTGSQIFLLVTMPPLGWHVVRQWRTGAYGPARQPATEVAA